MNIKELKPGDRATICGYQPGHSVYRHRLMAMGLTRHAEFQLLRRAPLGDPVELLVNFASVVVRQSEAACLKIKRLLDD